MLKLVLISVDGTIAFDGKLNTKIVDDLARLTAQLQEGGVKTVLWSRRPWLVNRSFPLAEYFSKRAGVEVQLLGNARGDPARRRSNSAAPILEKYGVEKHETVLVGGMQEDMMAGVNNQLLLIRPNWYGVNIDYGFPVESVDELARFLFVFAIRDHPIFWKKESGPLDMNAAGPFSTMREDYAEFGHDARSAAKMGSGRKEFWFYLTVSSLYFSGLAHQIDCICSYPGHDPRNPSRIRSEIDEMLSRFGKCFRKTYYHDLIVRHAAAPKSQSRSASQRTFTPQLNSIHLNPYPRSFMRESPRKTKLSLRNQTVLVVDDFCTSGRSFESARAYIQAAGGLAKHFSWLKTINTDYMEMHPLPELKPFEPNEVTEPGSIRHDYHSGITNHEAARELRKIFRKYVGWSSLSDR